jgi:DNA repair protein NreA
MSSIKEIKKKLESGWVQFLNSNASKLRVKNLSGASPPSVFVGQYGYPKVKAGPMIPPLHGDTTILDSPEKWIGKNIVEIANYRLSLVRAVCNVNVNTVSEKYVESLQELAMANRPAESELSFEQIPAIDIEQKKNFGFEADSAPFGLIAPLKTFKTSSSLSVDKRIENAFYDKDMPATQAIVNLYHKGVEVSKINRILSMGMLGIQKNRKLVPTKWSISATDDIVSSKMANELEKHQSIDFFEVYRYAHLGNHYSIILIPYDIWTFEMKEAWIDGKGNFGMGMDFEDSLGGLNHHPSIAGAYFAARLSISEYLNKINRKAAVLTLREIHPQYVIPVGVWQIREGIREALRGFGTRFDNFANALSFACNFLSISENEWIKNSKVYSIIKEQKKISDYF